jgi:hypothetical protein
MRLMQKLGLLLFRFGFGIALVIVVAGFAPIYFQDYQRSNVGVVQAANVISPFSDFTGTGAAARLTTSSYSVRQVCFIANPGNSNPIRIGGSNVGATTGARVAPGAGFCLGGNLDSPTASNMVQLNTVYYYGVSPDTFSVAAVQ